MYIFPIENGDAPACYASLPEGKSSKSSFKSMDFGKLNSLFGSWSNSLATDFHDLGNPISVAF